MVVGEVIIPGVRHGFESQFYFFLLPGLWVHVSPTPNLRLLTGKMGIIVMIVYPALACGELYIDGSSKDMVEANQ